MAQALERLLTLADKDSVHGDIGSRDRLIRTLRISNFEKLLRQFSMQHEDILETVAALIGQARDKGVSEKDILYQSVGLHEAMSPDEATAQLWARLDWEQIKSLAQSLSVAKGKTDQERGAAFLELYEQRLSEKPVDSNLLINVFLTSKGELRKSYYTKDVAQTDKDYLDWLAPIVVDYVAQYNAARIAEITYDTLLLFMDFSAIYRKLKRRSGALDFQDLIVQTRRLLHQTDMSSWVLYKLDGGLEHILVDEAQDTSEDQWAIVKALTSEFFAGDGASLKLTKAMRTVFAVGDEKQSIYGFQGARPDKFLETRQYFINQAHKSEQKFVSPILVHSFRSLPQILGFVDAAYDDYELAYALNFTTNVVNFEDTRIRHAAVRNDIGCIELWPPVMPIDTDDTEDDGTEVDPVDKTGATANPNDWRNNWPFISNPKSLPVVG